MMKLTKRFCVVFRTGGTDNFAWQRTTPTADVYVALAQADAIERGGRPAHVEDFDQSVALGLPDTFDVRFSIADDIRPTDRPSPFYHWAGRH